MLQHLTVRDVISGAVGVAGGCCHCAADGGVTAMAGVSLLSTPRACACFHVHLYMLGASTSEVVGLILCLVRLLTLFAHQAFGGIQYVVIISHTNAVA